MFKNSDNIVTITCDKCGKQETATPSNYNDVFYKSGWSINPSNRKNIHLCKKCTDKQQERRGEKKVVGIKLELSQKEIKAIELLGENAMSLYGCAEDEYCDETLTAVRIVNKMFKKNKIKNRIREQ